MVLSSLAASFPGGALKFDDLQYELRPEEYNKYVVYGQTKTANTLFVTELARRYKDAGILSFAVHPGGRFPVFLFPSYPVLILQQSLGRPTWAALLPRRT